MWKCFIVLVYVSGLIFFSPSLTGYKKIMVFSDLYIVKGVLNWECHKKEIDAFIAGFVLS